MAAPRADRRLSTDAPATIAFTRVGVLRVGDRFFYQPPGRKGVWLTARSIGTNGDRWWINANRSSGQPRSVSHEHITRIVAN